MTTYAYTADSQYTPEERRDAVSGGIWAAAQVGNGPLVRGLLNQLRVDDSDAANQVIADLSAAGFGNLLGGAR